MFQKEVQTQQFLPVKGIINARDLGGYVTADGRKVRSGKLIRAASDLGIEMHQGTIHSSDVFYHETSDYLKTVVDEKHCVAVEMESFALFHNANVLGKGAACLLTISDSFVTKQELSSEDRQNAFAEMMKLALETAIAL